MIPLEKIKKIVDTYNKLEKELASSGIKKEDLVKKSKEYSSIGDIINEARGYIGLVKEKKDLEESYKESVRQTKERKEKDGN